MDNADFVVDEVPVRRLDFQRLIGSRLQLGEVDFAARVCRKLTYRTAGNQEGSNIDRGQQNRDEKSRH